MTLTYHIYPPDGGADCLLGVSTTIVVALKSVNLAADAIARQYPRALSERTSSSSWHIVEPASRRVLATLVVSD